MTYNPQSSKHRAMRNLLRSLGVASPENPDFYSEGGTVTKDGIEAAQHAIAVAQQTLDEIQE